MKDARKQQKGVVELDGVGTETAEIGRKEDGKKRQSNAIVVDGVRYQIVRDRGSWRVRNRTKAHYIDRGLGVVDFRAACTKAREMVQNRKTAKTTRRTGAALEEFTEFYKSMPKRCGAVTAANNVGRLRAVIRAAWGKELSEVRLMEAGAKLWTDFFTRKLGRLDLNTRRSGNAALNTAVRCAASVFAPKLRAAYKEAGFVVPDDVTAIQWLPEMKRPPAPVNHEDMLKAWAAMPSNSALKMAVGIGRFAGLREMEIEAMRREWVVQRNGSVYIEIRDREEEGFLTKTGEIYRALVINEQVAAMLLAVPKGEPVVDTTPWSRKRWFKRTLPTWCKRYTGTASKPFHRLRGLYADDLARITQDAVAARLAGIKAAQEALGHTSSTTTERHYLSQQ